MSHLLLDYGKNDLMLPAQILSQAQLIATQISKPSLKVDDREIKRATLLQHNMCFLWFWSISFNLADQRVHGDDLFLQQVDAMSVPLGSQTALVDWACTDAELKFLEVWIASL